MTIKQIKKAINDVLIKNGCDVYSSETDEGFKKPVYFVDIFPVEKEKTTSVYETVRLSAEIQYEPSVETDEECIEKAEAMAQWFTAPIEVDDRKLTIYNLEFNTENAVLYVTFDIEFMQLIDENPPTIDNMESLKIREEVNSNGITHN
jgi:hypothetical protein